MLDRRTDLYAEALTLASNVRAWLHRGETSGLSLTTVVNESFRIAHAAPVLGIPELPKQAICLLGYSVVPLLSLREEATLTRKLSDSLEALDAYLRLAIWNDFEVKASELPQARQAALEASEWLEEQYRART